MKAYKIHLVVFLLIITIAFTGCEISNLENVATNLELPSYPFDYEIGGKDEIPTLGRVLFYDPRLSANNAVSCASCHQQRFAFADNKRLSTGFKGEATVRNSMPIQNIVSTAFPFGVEADSSGSFTSTSLFWDGRQDDVITMVMEPIQNHIEMGINDMSALMTKIQSIPDYGPLFKSAFGTEKVNKDYVAIALAAFVVSIRSDESRFDLANKGVEFLTAEEEIGLDLFFTKYQCNNCHQVQRPVNGYQFAVTDSVPNTTPTTQLIGFADIGLDKDPTDLGAMRATGQTEDKGKFRIPSLRNVAVTAPYMHDGRFETLEDVIDHYSHGIQDSENLDANLRTSNGTPKVLNISPMEKYQIITFLHSMTDHSLRRDERFSNPFKVR